VCRRRRRRRPSVPIEFPRMFILVYYVSQITSVLSTDNYLRNLLGNVCAHSTISTF
jgi:hypothetical protein